MISVETQKEKQMNLTTIEQWQNLARELGFEFHEGLDTFAKSPHILAIAAEEFPGKRMNPQQLQQLMNSPLVHHILGKLFLGIARGTYQEYEFFIYRKTTSSSNSNLKHYTVNIVLFFNHYYQLGMQVTRAGSMTRLGKKLFSGSYIRLPHQETDRLLKIKGKEKNQIREILSATGLQAPLTELFSLSRQAIVKITDTGIRVNIPGHFPDKDQALEIMKHMVAVARKL